MNRRNLLFAAAIFVLAAQALTSRILRREPFLPSVPPLVNLPLNLAGWTRVNEEPVDPAAFEMLGPDDILARLYRDQSTGENAELFVAYYKTQLRAKNAHDPKVCLPGAGWNPVESRLEHVSLSPGKQFPVNYYRIRKSDSQEVVVYWFQTPNGAYTFEQELRAHRIWDAIATNRTDMALVRIVVPVGRKGVAAAEADAHRLASVVYVQMLSYFPPTEKARS